MATDVGFTSNNQSLKSWHKILIFRRSWVEKCILLHPHKGHGGAFPINAPLRDEGGSAWSLIGVSIPPKGKWLKQGYSSEAKLNLSQDQRTCLQHLTLESFDQLPVPWSRSYTGTISDLKTRCNRVFLQFSGALTGRNEQERLRNHKDTITNERVYAGIMIKGNGNDKFPALKENGSALLVGNFFKAKALEKQGCLLLWAN